MGILNVAARFRYNVLRGVSTILPAVAFILVTIAVVCNIITRDVYMGAVSFFFALAFWYTIALFLRKRNELEFMLETEKRKLLCLAYAMPYQVSICELFGFLGLLLTSISVYRLYSTWHPSQTTNALFHMVAFGYLWVAGYAWSYIDRARELKRRKEHGLCVICLYDVAKSGPISRCPECGTAINE